MSNRLRKSPLHVPTGTSHEPCDAVCGCADCYNPLNGVDVAALSECALYNIEAVKALSKNPLRYLVPAAVRAWLSAAHTASQGLHVQNVRHARLVLLLLANGS